MLSCCPPYLTPFLKATQTQTQYLKQGLTQSRESGTSTQRLTQPGESGASIQPLQWQEPPQNSLLLPHFTFPNTTAALSWCGQEQNEKYKNNPYALTISGPSVSAADFASSTNPMKHVIRDLEKEYNIHQYPIGFDYVRPTPKSISNLISVNKAIEGKQRLRPVRDILQNYTVLQPRFGNVAELLSNYRGCFPTTELEPGTIERFASFVDQLKAYPVYFNPDFSLQDIGYTLDSRGYPKFYLKGLPRDDIFPVSIHPFGVNQHPGLTRSLCEKLALESLELLGKNQELVETRKYSQNQSPFFQKATQNWVEAFYCQNSPPDILS